MAVSRDPAFKYRFAICKCTDGHCKLCDSEVMQIFADQYENNTVNGVVVSKPGGTTGIHSPDQWVCKRRGSEDTKLGSLAGFSIPTVLDPVLTVSLTTSDLKVVCGRGNWSFNANWCVKPAIPDVYLGVDVELYGLGYRGTQMKMRKEDLESVCRERMCRRGKDLGRLMGSTLLRMMPDDDDSPGQRASSFESCVFDSFAGLVNSNDLLGSKHEALFLGREAEVQTAADCKAFALRRILETEKALIVPQYEFSCKYSFKKNESESVLRRSKLKLYVRCGIPSVPLTRRVPVLEAYATTLETVNFNFDNFSSGSSSEMDTSE